MDRRHFLAGIMSTSALPACADAPATSMRAATRPDDLLARSAPDAERLIAAARLGGDISTVVADAHTGEVLESVNPIRLLPPASVAKAVTALYALETLGPDHRFETTLVATGPIREGRLDGDLVLVGGGDPGMDTDGLHDLVEQAKAAGLRAVGGRLLIWDGALPLIERIDPTQPEHVGYNPSISGLNVNFNRVHFAWRRAGTGYETSMEARTERFRPEVSTSRIAVENRTLPVYTYRDGGDVDLWTVARAQLGGSGSRWLPVRNPAQYAGEVLSKLLAYEEVEAPAPERVLRRPQGGAVIARTQSAPLDRIVRSMLRYSTNITAEVLGLASSVRRGLNTGTLDASGAMMTRWLEERAGLGRADFDDHSGLNGTTRVSGLGLVRVLTAAGAEARVRPLMRELTIEADRNIPVQAKTGTLNFASCLAGYFNARSGRPLAFATLTADVERRAGLSVAQRDRPEGGREWARRSRSLQFDLIERWWTVHA
ncbi:D-alanyl-D-alanine carboxypeptidase/D-alanyl-D-alanine-endopeptidase [Jannaschia sp. W003]|uniref:D-alanyl-D-alanine carboxypeptidase/D-alanyl-D-alanine endopeptidase n=1 Tax=Jannaschia sp. W003 TaxID=2867012 RepID=UPI0021A61A87|nr:D-alanyl-D-alanine carboxypeptidase/D-alanyl-D-alanine-endopeptidase [Jannaschia sp. W003]UWQ21813.1 D-alanyl-D-alanine carboxypeptidase/D-alanyl-D-alanine-endopeptidase [Jannaschia sp. W003]